MASGLAVVRRDNPNRLAEVGHATVDLERWWGSPGPPVSGDLETISRAGLWRGRTWAPLGGGTSVRSVLTAQRRALIALRDRGKLDDDEMRRIERELDLEDSRLEI